MSLGLNTTITVLALICALGATVLAFIFIVPENKRKKLNKIGKLLHDILNFRFLIIEKILQALYIFSTAFSIMAGFFMLFRFETYNYIYVTRTVWGGGWGLLLMILGPIVIRLVYEGMMMLILLVKNVIQINNKVEAPNSADGNKTEDIFGVNMPFSSADEKKEEKNEDEEDLHTTLMSESIDMDFSVKQPEVKAKAAVAFCPHCGAKVDGGVFCSVCGKFL